MSIATEHELPAPAAAKVTREYLLHALYEAAELEHTLMCTYLYAAFSLRTGDDEGLSARELEAVRRWSSTILSVALDEMGHLAAVSNITAALGGAPHFDRDNFPLGPGSLPAGVVVKLAAFSESVLQHFVYLERPAGSNEPDGAGFAPEYPYRRGVAKPRLTPMASDYATVGEFYEGLGEKLHEFVARVGERVAFAGDPACQLARTECGALDVQPVRCLSTALDAFKLIIEQGEGAPAHSTNSHYQRFVGVRDEYRALLRERPTFSPAFPSATNPVLRPPLHASGRVWMEDEEAARTVDLANACYALMLRLLAYSYNLPRPSPERALVIELATALMRASTPLAERAARLAAGPSHPGCNAGMSFTALRDAAPLLRGRAAHRFFVERTGELVAVASELAQGGDLRTKQALQMLSSIAKRAERGLSTEPTPVVATPNVIEAKPPAAPSPVAATEPTPRAANGSAPERKVVDGVEYVEGKKLTLIYEGKRCIHARFCVTGAPTVFLANVQGPWIHPDTMDAEGLVAIAHACPSGAIRYRRKDDRPDETAPPVNLLAIREAGPYAVRGELSLDGENVPYRATLCRCGASKNKPFCDSSHKEIGFTASGEPESTKLTDMLPVRNGPLEVNPEPNGPLEVRGNLEITSGTGRVVARLTSTRLCRCGASKTKPFCDRSHVAIGFRT